MGDHAASCPTGLMGDHPALLPVGLMGDHAAFLPVGLIGDHPALLPVGLIGDQLALNPLRKVMGEKMGRGMVFPAWFFGGVCRSERQTGFVQSLDERCEDGLHTARAETVGGACRWQQPKVVVCRFARCTMGTADPE